MQDLRLKTFYSVAKNLSFTKAAHELCISQPAITKQINLLENEYEVRLFNRLGHKIELTSAGHKMLEYCQRIINEYNELDYNMHLLRQKHIGSLRLGASTTISQYILPKILALFTQNFKDVKISLINGNSQFIEKELELGNIDLGFVEGINHSPALMHVPFYKDELVVITAFNNQNIEKEISLNKFIQHPIILREFGSGSLECIEKNLQDNSIKLSNLNILMHLGSTEAIKRFIINSECISILSMYAIEKELLHKEIKIIDVDKLNFTRDFCFIFNKGAQNPLVNVFKDFVSFNLNKL